MDLVDPLAILPNLGIYISEIAIAVLIIPLPKTPTINIANSSAGTANKISLNHINILSQ